MVGAEQRIAPDVHGSMLFVDGGSDALFRPDHV